MEGGGTGIGAYRFMLEQNLGKTMLEFQVKILFLLTQLTMLEFQVTILFLLTQTINYARIPGFLPFLLTQLTMLEF